MALTRLNSKQVSFTPLGTGAVTADVHTKASERVSVFDWMTAAQIADVKAGTALVDVTDAIQAAFDDVLNLGHANQIGKTLYIPSGNYKVTSLTLGGIGGVTTSDVYHKNIICEGKIYGTNASGPVITLEGALSVNIYGLRVHNTSTAAGSIAMKATRAYAINWFGCKFTGGETAFQLQGNNNSFIGCGFTYSKTGFLISGNTANCLSNTLDGCDFEQNDTYDINVNRTSGTLPTLTIKNSYFENKATTTAMVRLYNVLDVEVDSCYFGFGYTGDGVVFGGSLTPANYGPTATGNRNKVTNCAFVMNGASIKANCLALESGTSNTYMRFARYGNLSLYGNVNADTVLGTTGAYAGATNSGYTYGINLDGKRRAVNITNFDFSTLTGGAGSAPSSWTAGGGATLTSGTTISEYGYGKKIIIDAGNASQQLIVKPYTLYHFTAMSDVTGASGSTSNIRIYEPTITTSLAESSSTTSTTPTQLEGWWYSDTRSTAAIVLRESVGSADSVEFSEIRMIDFTN